MSIWQRIGNAFLVFFGLRTVDLPPGEMVKIRAQWTSVALDIADTMEQMEKWVGRVRQQEYRKTKKKESEPSQKPSTPATPKSKKSDLYRRAAAKRTGIPSRRSFELVPSEGNGEEEDE